MESLSDYVCYVFFVGVSIVFLQPYNRFCYELLILGKSSLVLLLFSFCITITVNILFSVGVTIFVELCD